MVLYISMCMCVYILTLRNDSVQFSRSVISDSLWPPWTAARQASLPITNSQSLLKLMSIESVMPSNHLILCHPLLLPPSIFPSIRIFSNELIYGLSNIVFYGIKLYFHHQSHPQLGVGFRFGSVSSFFLELLLQSSPVAYWAPTDLGSLSFSVLSFCLFIHSWGSQDKITEVVCHSLLQWTTFCQHFPPWPIHLGWPYTAWLIVHWVRQGCGPCLWQKVKRN